MKKLYFTLLFLVFGFLVSAQTSTEVGITEGQLSVSLSGAANYSIPIAVPLGINGVVPQISLVYNSQGGNGLAGYGWNISGVSTISRIASAKFHDGAIDPVDLNALNHFALDGQRLLVKNGTSRVYGANGTEYETESFSNLKITSYGVHPDGAKFGPSYFIVEYPDGSKASYGSFADTYKNGCHWQILDNATSAVLWQVNDINAKEQLLNAQSGTVRYTRTYDTYGFALQYKYDKISSLKNIFTINTVFDVKTGNLTNRRDNIIGRIEDYKYDAQDRLTEFQNFGIKDKQSYDVQGRIKQNTLGVYNYDINDIPYQNSSITITPEAVKYYTERPTQSIAYNTFKSPVQIEEVGIDKISFDYNDQHSRTAMFYGGLQTDKLQRPLRKYYSADGSMEINENIVTGILEFVSFVGGDGYTAPIVVKSNGEKQNYLFLQRDYLI